MNIKEVRQDWPKDLLRIDLTLGNFCNYKCWYCWPMCNKGDMKWPEFDIFVKNLSHLLDYYIANTEKRKFDFHVMGGEITHWPKFFDLIAYFKNKYDCIFTLTTNGSKKLDWWAKAAPYLDFVSISCHHQFCDPEHVRNVADLLYEHNIIVTAEVLMDPFEWDKCVEIVEVLKTSRRRWSIKYLEIVHERVKYSEEQSKILEGPRVRSGNWFWFLRNNKSYRSNVKVVDENNKVLKLKDQIIILKRLNSFKGWECSVGVNWVAVKLDGTVSGICGNKLYRSGETFNIFKEDFIEKFQPSITPSICDMNSCWCMFETNMPKRKVITIHEH